MLSLCVKLCLFLAVWQYVKGDCSSIDTDWTSYGPGLCAWVSKEKASWVDAMTTCHYLESDLLQITSQSQNDMITAIIQMTYPDKHWLGLTKMSSGVAFKYRGAAINPLLSYSAFEHGSMDPDKKCAYIDKTGLWGCEDCHSELPFICTKRI